MTSAHNVPTPPDIPSVAVYEQYLPATIYARQLRGRINHHVAVRQEEESFRADHPMLAPEYRETLIADDQAYQALLAGVACGDVSAADALRGILKSTPSAGSQEASAQGPRLEQLGVVWAVAGLCRTSPGFFPEKRLTNDNQRGVARKLEPLFHQFSEVIRITGRHGHDELPLVMREFVVQYLVDEPPAWMYQLLADTVTHPDQALVRADETIVDALVYDLEQTFDCTLRDRQGQIDQRMLQCLIECRFLQLSDYANVSEPVRRLLTARSSGVLCAIKTEALPMAAQATHMALLTHRNEMGGNPSRRQQVTELGRRVASGLATLRGLGHKE
jgi:hypothetical protein